MNTKIRQETFSTYDHAAIVRRLEEMAQKGWRLEKIGFFGWRYRRCDPQTLHYAVTYDAKEVPTPEGNVVDFCARNGWKRVAAWEQLAIYCNEAPDPPPLEVDPAQGLDALRAEENQQISLLWVVLLGAGAIFLGTFLVPFLRGREQALGNRDLVLLGVEGVLFLLFAGVELYWCFRGSRGKREEYHAFLRSADHLWMQRFMLAGMLLCIGYRVFRVPLPSWTGVTDLLLDLLVIWGLLRWGRGRSATLGSLFLQLLLVAGAFLALMAAALFLGPRQGGLF